MTEETTKVTMKYKKLLIALLITVSVLAIAFFVLNSSYHKDMEKWAESDYLPDNIIINSVDCSEMSIEEAKTAISKKQNEHDFVIKKSDGAETVLPLEGTRYKVREDLHNCVNTQTFFQYLGHRFGKAYEIDIPMNVAITTDEFEYAFSLFTAGISMGTVETKDAYIDLSNTDFNIVKEVYGDIVNIDKIRDKIYSLIKKDKYTLEYSDEDFYDKPELTADSQEIADRLEYCNTYLTAQISYKFGNVNDTITPEDLDKLLTVKDGKIAGNEDEIAEFVSALAAQYDTYSSNRTFKTTAGRTVSLRHGNYGYVIDQKKEAAQLKKDIETGGDILREPVYSIKGNGRNGIDDILNTYVEVDLTTQNMYYYKDGKLIVSSPCVSGRTTKDEHGETHGTIPGVFTIAYKDRDATLKGGDKKKGTDYESEVKYWMPFCNGIGLHDAPWRSEFGGTIYKKNGSHGCINLPESAAKTLFDNVNAGTIVVVFY